jgi:energy-coupling factor transport system permease protein
LREFSLTVGLIAFQLGMHLPTAKTSSLDLGDGLIGLPGRVCGIGLSANELAPITTTALGFVLVVVDEADSPRKIQLTRGADFGGGLIRRISGLVPLKLPLFITAFGRADRLTLARWEVHFPQIDLTHSASGLDGLQPMSRGDTGNCR